MSVFSNNLLLGAGGQSAAAFDTTLIGNSVWLDGSADFLSAELGAKTRTKAVIGTWIQKTGFTTSDATIFSKKGSAHFAMRMQDQASKDGKISIFDYDGGSFQYSAESTSMLLRDNGWYHIMISIDTTADAGSRLKYYINGIDQTSTLTVSTDYTASDNPSITGGSGEPTQWGVGPGGASQFNPCYLAQSFMLDDDSIQNGDVAVTDILDAFTFGTNGSQYVPKADADIAALATTAGGNSFCLDFADSADLGNDISSNNNDFTPTSMAAANQTTNTPSLVYPRVNVLRPSISGKSFSEGALKVSSTSAFGNGNVLTTFPLSTGGYWYWEIIDAAAAANQTYGIATADSVPNASGLGGDTKSWGFYNNQYRHNGNIGAVPDSPTNTGTRYMFAVDVDAGKFFMGADGTWWKPVGGSTAGDPAAGTNPAFTDTDIAEGDTFPAMDLWSSDSATFVFQDTDFAHTVPTGYLSLNTANLSAPDSQGVDNFAVTLAQEGSLFSDMGTAEANFTGSGTVRIYKSRTSGSGTESWGYSFSHDATNEYVLPSLNGAMTYGSLRTLSGTDNWAGYSIGISESAGTAMGVQAHSNGTDTTITHGLTTSRCIILLFNRSGGDILYFHPDIASGTLLKLNNSVLPFSSTIITNVTTTTFDIGSAAGSATYDYLVLAETPGMTDIFSYTGNSSTDGPFIALNARPEFLVAKLTTTHVTEYVLLDKERYPFNGPNMPLLMPNQIAAESDSVSFITDFLASSLKLRNTGTDMNFGTGLFVGWTFGSIAGNGTLPPIYGQ